MVRLPFFILTVSIIFMMMGWNDEMTDINQAFQVFIKPVGAQCNMACHYCYYLDRVPSCPDQKGTRMPDEILETYIVHHLQYCKGSPAFFSWHGGEPTLAGLDFFRKVVDMQKKHRGDDQQIFNGIQTNGTLLDEEWGRFMKSENFMVGLSMDGPEDLHDRYRFSKDQRSTFRNTLEGLNILKKFGVHTELLCVVNADNVPYPSEVYRFFKSLDVPYMTFLPLVERIPGSQQNVSGASVDPQAFGEFLCAIFDEWVRHDIGKIKIQIIEEAIRTAFDQDHTLCIFKKTCGGVPVIEQNGDFYCCDHYVDPEHRIGNIRDTALGPLLEHPRQKAFGQAKWDSLPDYCRQCEVLSMCHGECPRNRFIYTPDGEGGLNYLCQGYRRFYSHIRPFVDEVARIWHQQDGSVSNSANR
jgi:uncharacterized protein